MTSYPPDKCCFVAFKHEGEAKGNITQLGGYDCYVTYPEDRSTRLGVLIFPDFMGYELINVRLIADQLAAAGYFTVIPDVWEGDNVPLDLDQNADSFNLEEWVKRHGPDRVMPIVEATMNAMRRECGVERLGGVGYCLGAKYVCRNLAKGKSLDVGYFAHPSLVTPDEVKAIAGPLSIAAAETDSLFPASKRHETEAILMNNDSRYQINLYSGVEHGFALKADLSKPDAKFATDTAFLQMVNWFNHYVKSEI